MILNYLLPKLYKQKDFERIIENLSKGKKEQKIVGLSNFAKAYFFAALFQRERRAILILLPTQSEAEELYQNLLLFTENAFLFPSWETLPYEEQKPSDMLMGERLKILFRLIDQDEIILVAYPRSISYKIIPAKDLSSKKIIIKKNKEIDRDVLVRKLVSFGYERSEQVDEEGYFRVQGGIIDIYSPADFPVRIEFFGDSIESIREFDIFTQRSIRQFEEIVILPRNEYMIEDQDKAKVSFFKYLLKETLVVIDEAAEFWLQCKNMEKEIDDFYQEKLLIKEKVPCPSEVFVSTKDIENDLLKYSKIHTLLIDNENIKTTETFFNFISSPKNYTGAFDLFMEDLLKWQEEGYEVVILVKLESHKERILNLIQENKDINKDDIKIKIIEEKTISHGFLIEEIKIVIITEQEIWGRLKIPKRKYKEVEKTFVKDYRELDVKDYVVHVSYGIGRYLGIKSMESQGVKRDYLAIEYANNDKIYLPLDQMHLIEKYIGEENPRIYPLGGNLWEQTKKRVKKAVQKIAKELLELYAYRKTIPGTSFSKDSKWQYEFEESFIYEETDDQLRTIIEVKKDMECSSPMDRLVCGDVGYGKTEVAMRAAFKAAVSNKQVEVLVPTTILAQQHYLTFKERFKDFPICVEMISRFRTSKEQKRIIEELKQGKIDIVIGTHRLLQKDVAYKNLGLLVIDEEQRFGVSHKEKIKKLHKNVDVLSLTATPIPRTLHMSLVGIRDMSIINTPPPDRLPIRTLITKFDENIVRKAILRELDRGGQIYFVHNKVATIENMYYCLSSSMPEINIAIAHGQMSEKELEKVMIRFVKKEYDLLLSTSIIESGLDIPSVNTIIINNAHEFGLSQLYQLRGRVGRAKHIAYAYLLYPEQKVLSKVAQERLKAIMECTELGSGFKIAMRDLEIRGAGNILGSEQHGNILAVGFDLYCKLLSQEIAMIKGESIPVEINPKIDLGIDAYIPENIVSDSKRRQIMYRKMASLESINELEEYKKELKDRFREIPKEIYNLLEIIEMKIIAKEIKVESVTIIKNEAWIKFAKGEDKVISKLIKLIQSNSNLKLDPNEQNILKVINIKSNVGLIKNILHELS
ncbi:MAG: transcription-repair coupling factor [bacterium]|nr:transcription-repair coupling factor [bacterium]